VNNSVVLPVNWRSNLSFEDGGPMKEGDEDHGDFSLRDITPASIPAVRSLISDVMLDIPFYSKWFRYLKIILGEDILGYFFGEATYSSPLLRGVAPV